MMKYHYPSIELENIKEGLASNFSNEEVPALMEEVKATTFAIADAFVQD